jgi:hypothetical protein
MNPKSILILLMTILITGTIIQCKEGTKRDNESSGIKAGVEETSPQQREKPKLVHDERGNVIERHSYSYRQSDGSIRSADSYYYQYDDRDNVIKEVKESFDPDGSMNYKNVNYYTYNQDNLQTEIRFESYNSDNLLERKARHAFRYNKSGQKIEDIGYYESGAIKSKIMLEYDQAGILRSEEYIDYNEDGRKTSHKKYYYSQSGLEKTVDMMGS